MGKAKLDQTTADIRKVLRSAASEGTYAHIWVSGNPEGQFADIVEVGKDFVAYLRIDIESMSYSGPNVVRIRAIMKAELAPEFGVLVRLGLQLMGRSRPAIPSVRLDKLAHSIADLSERSPLIQIEGEQLMNSGYWIGHVQEVSRTHIVLFEISPAGKWVEEPASLPLRMIDKVSINSGYMEALFRISKHYFDLEQEAEQAAKHRSPRQKRKSH